MTYYTVNTKTVSGELIHVRSHYKESQAYEDIKFFKENGSTLEFVVTEHEEKDTQNQ